jgi:hypothetical protein
MTWKKAIEDNRKLEFEQMPLKQIAREYWLEVELNQ